MFNPSAPVRTCTKGSVEEWKVPVLQAQAWISEQRTLSVHCLLNLPLEVSVEII